MTDPDPSEEALKEIRTALDALDTFVWKIEEQENKNVKPPLTAQPIAEPQPDKMRETKQSGSSIASAVFKFSSIIVLVVALVVVCTMLGYSYGRDKGNRLGITYAIEAVKSCQKSLQEISNRIK